MQYLEAYPIGSLSHYVKSYWRMTCNLPNNMEMISRDIPNGDFHVLFNLGSAFKNIQGGNEVIFNNGIIKGQQSKYLRIVQSNGFDIVGISFHPWGLYPFTNIPSKEFYNQTVNVNDFFNSSIEDRLFGLKFNEQVLILENYLMEKLSKYENKSFLIELIASDIINNKGRVNINGYLQKYNISHKHLMRGFHELIGITPKKLSGLCRVNAIIDTLNTSNNKPDWVDIVVKNNYHDHPHMIKDFKKVVGLTPEKFIKTNDSIYQHYSSHFKLS